MVTLACLIVGAAIGGGTFALCTRGNMGPGFSFGVAVLVYGIILTYGPVLLGK